MSANLRGVYAKIARADEHLDAVVNEMKAWIDRDPYSLIGEKDPEGRERVLRLAVNEVVPPRLAATIGDCVHNLRGALDHLVYAGAVTHQGRDPDDPHLIQFPVFDTPKKWANGWHRRIGQVAPALQAEIERLQPYHRPNTFAVDPLRMVVQMDNIDKHRELHPVLVPIQQFLWLTTEPHTLLCDFNRPVEDGAEIARLILDVPNPEMKVQWQVSLVPSLQHEPFEGQTFAPVDAMLGKLTDEVRNVIAVLIQHV